MGTDSKKIQEELQFLLEEDNRVITFKFVSANFGIHVNDAKRQLQALLGACRGRGDDDVTATFYLSGLCDEQDDYVSQKLLVVSEDQLAAARGSLTSVTSEHVFSVQRHRVCETTVLYGADQQERQADPTAYNSHGAITNSRAERIPEAELLKSRQAALPPAAQPPRRPAAPAPAPAVKKESAAAGGEKPSESSPAHQKSSGADGQDASAEREKSKSATSGKSGSATKRGATIDSMFAKAATADKKTKSPPKKSAGGGMMASFLQKGAERKPAASGGDASSAAAAATAAPATVTESEESDALPPKTKPVSPVKPAKTEPEKGSETVRFGAKKSTTSSGGRGAGKAVSGRAKRPRKGDGGAGPAKQRRRIQVLASDSSESSDDDGIREEEEPEPEPLPPPPESDEDEPARPAPQQHTRKRKLVTKTFEDDEGFMVTKKVYESCSGSESEEPPAKKGAPAKEKTSAAPAPALAPAPAPAQAEAAKPSKPKETAQHKVKQAGIMSFFKKK